MRLLCFPLRWGCSVPDRHLMPVAVHTPRINNNDDTVRLSHLFVERGAQVRAGDPLADVETDKATFTVEAEQDGYVLDIKGEIGDELAVGSVLMWVGASADETLPETGAAPVNGSGGNSEPTLKAMLLLAQHGIDASSVPASGERLSAGDVLNYIQAHGRRAPDKAPGRTISAIPVPPDTRKIKLGQQDRGMLRTVVWQRDQAVAGYVEFAYDPSAWDQYAGDFQKRNSLLVSPLVSLVAWRVARLAAMNEKMNAFAQDDEVYTYHRVHLGFTVQTAESLFLVVVRDADKMPELAFVQSLGVAQRNAMKHALRPEETSGATVGFTSMARWPVTRHIPILPPQTCLMVAHTAARNGSAVLGATYDHRVLTGADVVGFLKELSAPPEETTTP
jgi:pyruvate/2-oxoglutarate dehydrogenase complex dihydrolipoamide acyltransferase (E2) component